MPASIQNPADIVNLALVRVGFDGRIGNLYDGSKASKAALTIYGQTRDDLLYNGDYDFAERSTTLTLLKQAPDTGYIPPVAWSSTYPALPWFFEYGFPDDCLRVRAVKPTPLFVPNFSPQHNIYTIDNDNSFTPAQRVILCNVPAAILTYVGRVTDPTTMDVAFVEELAAALGRRLAPVLVGLDAAKMAASDEQAMTAQAQIQQD